MSKGFLMFSDEEPGLTMLKDEPDDLTHLAPTAGDVCIPLEDNPIISDMLNDFLGENYCPLFTDDLQSLDSECSKTSDPFISYQDEYDDCSTSPHLLSPTLSKSSECTVPSLCSPGNSLIEDEHMNTFISLQMDEEEPPPATPSKKAPFITLQDEENLPLLRSNDLMWNPIPIQKITKSSKPNMDSHLAQMLRNGIEKCNKLNDHGGGLIHTISTNSNHRNGIDWSTKSARNQILSQKPERANKRTCNSPYDPATKRTKNDTKDKLSSELLQQLIANNNQRQRTRSKNSWIMDSGGKTQAACVSQPSDSVLMNLLEQFPQDVEMTFNIPLTVLERNHPKPPDDERRLRRKNSTSLLDGQIPSLVDLTQQDYEVNAPVNSFLLQGQDLIRALDISSGLC